MVVVCGGKTDTLKRREGTRGQRKGKGGREYSRDERNDVDGLRVAHHLQLFVRDRLFPPKKSESARVSHSVATLSFTRPLPFPRLSCPTPVAGPRVNT
eukprot:3120051-Rhodomonas_salina.4